MAYTTTISSGNLTAVGSSGTDDLGTLAAPSQGDGTVQINSYEGNDTVFIGQFESGTVGMGGGTDAVTISTTAVEKINVTLGDGADEFTSALADDEITVGGQGGADTFTIDASNESRYAGGRGRDSFSFTGAAVDATLVGGSETDTFVLGTAVENIFVNGQNGDDVINVTFAIAGTVNTIRGGAGDDTITSTAANAGDVYFGDNGADTITDFAGANTLNGGGGADTINGGAGFDTIIGGEGADRLVIDTTESGLANAVVAFAAADTAVFQLNNGGGTLQAEIVQGFETGTDTIVLEAGTFGGAGNTTAARNAFTDADAGIAAIATSAYFMYGTYNAALGTFDTSAAGADSLLFTQDANAGGFTATADYVVFSGAQIAATDIAYA